MKKELLHFLLLAIMVILFFGCGGGSNGDEKTSTTPTTHNSDQFIIADHTVINEYNQIPQQYLDIVKTYWVQLLGESHSRAYRDGLVFFENQEPRFQAEIVRPIVNKSMIITNFAG